MSSENLTKEVVDDCIDTPFLIFSGSNQDVSQTSSQSSLTKHLDTTNNYNSKPSQPYNNDSSSKLKTILKNNDSGNNLTSSFTNDENKYSSNMS